MTLTPRNRNVIALTIFLVCDHFIWYYCGIFEHVSTFYSMTSEVIRVSSIFGIASLYLNKKYACEVVFLIVIYCFLMLPFLIISGRLHYVDGSIIDNILYIRKHDEKAIDSPFIAFFWYIYFMAGMYYFAWKKLDAA